MFRRLILLVETLFVGFAFILSLAVGSQILEAVGGGHHKFDNPWEKVVGLSVTLVLYILVYGAIRWVITSSPFPFTSLPEAEKRENDQ